MSFRVVNSTGHLSDLNVSNATISTLRSNKTSISGTMSVNGTLDTNGSVDLVLPTSPNGLPDYALWNNNGVVSIVTPS